MLRRQASNSAQPETGRPSGRMGTGQAGHRIFGSRTSPAGSGAFGQAHCHRLRRSFGFGGVGQDRVSARELRTRQDPAFRRMTCQAEPRLRPRILPDAISRASAHGNADGKEEGLRFLIRRAANRPGFGPAGSHRGHHKGFGPDGLRRMRGRDLSRLPRLETAHRERPASAEPDTKGQWGPAAMPGPITVRGIFPRHPPLCSGAGRSVGHGHKLRKPASFRPALRPSPEHGGSCESAPSA